MKKTGIVIGLMAFGVFPAAAQEMQTLEQTFRQVYLHNPALEASRYGMKATDELYPQAVAGWHPSITAETGITSTDIDSSNFSEGTGASTKNMAIIAEQPLYRGGRTMAETRGAVSRIEAGRAELRGTEQDVFLSTVESYMDVIRDRELVFLRQKNEAFLEQELKSLNARFGAGDVTRTDVALAEARLSSAEAGSIAAYGSLESSMAVFEDITGMAPAHNMAIPEVRFIFPDNIPALMAMAEQRNPDLAASRAGYEASKTDIGVAGSDLYPQVNAFASYVKEYDPQPGIIEDSAVGTVGVRARVPLYEGGRVRSRVREAKNRAHQRSMQVREAESRLKGEVIVNWRRWQAAKAELAAREREIMAARLSAEGVRAEARMGERTVLETLEAEQDALDAETALVRARRDMIVSAYALASALGMLTPVDLGMEDIAYDPGIHGAKVRHRLFSTKED